VLAKVTGACAELGINIDEIRSLRDPDEANSIAILRTNLPLPDEAMEKVSQAVEPEVIFTLSLA
jgi:hypothetical protein